MLQQVRHLHIVTTQQLLPQPLEHLVEQGSQEDDQTGPPHLCNNNTQQLPSACRAPSLQQHTTASFSMPYTISATTTHNSFIQPAVHHLSNNNNTQRLPSACRAPSLQQQQHSTASFSMPCTISATTHNSFLQHAVHHLCNNTQQLPSACRDTISATTHNSFIQHAVHHLCNNNGFLQHAVHHLCNINTQQLPSVCRAPSLQQQHSTASFSMPCTISATTILNSFLRHAVTPSLQQQQLPSACRAPSLQHQHTTASFSMLCTISATTTQKHKQLPSACRAPFLQQQRLPSSVNRLHSEPHHDLSYQ